MHVAWVSLTNDLLTPVTLYRWWFPFLLLEQ